MIVLAEFEPLDTVGGSRVTLRATNADHPSVTGLNSVRWWPAMSEAPSLNMRLFKGDFDGQLEAGQASFSVRVDGLAKLDANARQYRWAGAPVRFYAGIIGQAWPWTQVFEGLVERFEGQGNSIRITARVDTEPFQKNVLASTYAGTGGIEGGADLKNKPKPLLMGRCVNVEPILINATDSIYQFHGYGSIEAVNALYERGSSFGASIGDYASYAALLSADIPAGRWGTCLAKGLIRLGAPAYGVITGDVDGDNASGWKRKTGEIITRIGAIAGVTAGAIDTTSMTALDTALSSLPNQGRIGLFLADQENVLDLAARLAGPCNAQVGVSFLGKLFAMRAVIDTPTLTLDAQGRQLPPVLDSVESDVSPPFTMIEFGWGRSWRVHSFSELAFYNELLERGDYQSGETYREGNIVLNPLDGIRYVYINPTPSSGNSPPNTSYWEALSSSPAGIQTSRDASPPAQMPEGSVWISPTGRQYRFEGTALLFGGDPILFNGDPVTVSGWIDIQDQAIGTARAVADAAIAEARLATAALSAIDDDGIIDVSEKVTVLIPKAAVLQSSYDALTSAAIAQGVSITVVSAARSAWLAQLAAISPAWNNYNVNSAVDRSTYQAALDAYEAALAALNTATADLTNAAVPTIECPATFNLTANYLGEIEPAQQLPASIKATRKRGNVDVSGSTTWSIVDVSGLQSGSSTITVSANGAVALPSGLLMGAEVNFKVRSVRDGVTLDAPIKVIKTNGMAPSTGGSGGTTVSDTSFSAVSGTSFVAISDLMTVKTGSSGQIAFNAPLTAIAAAASPTGTFDVELKWQWRAVGGSFADAAVAVASNPDAEVFSTTEDLAGGNVTFYARNNGTAICSPTKSGLSANTDYEVQLFARRTSSSPAKSISFSGTASATGS